MPANQPAPRREYGAGENARPSGCPTPSRFTCRSPECGAERLVSSPRYVDGGPSNRCRHRTDEPVSVIRLPVVRCDRSDIQRHQATIEDHHPARSHQSETPCSDRQSSVEMKSAPIPAKGASTVAQPNHGKRAILAPDRPAIFGGSHPEHPTASVTDRPHYGCGLMRFPASLPGTNGSALHPGLTAP